MKNVEGESVIEGFRIVEMKNGRPHTLFHGIQGETRRTKELPTGEWVRADVKVVNDGGGNYLSGFHFMEDLEKLKSYMASFTAQRTLHIINILARDVYPKPTNTNVSLSRYMLIPSDYESFYTQG